jgi:beta-glucosidase
MVVENAKENSLKDNTTEALQQGLISRGELQRSAKNICEVLLKSEAFARLQRGEELDASSSSTYMQSSSQSIKIEDGSHISMDGVDTTAGNEKSFEIDVESGGTYIISFNTRSNLNPLAQIPVNVLINDKFIATFVFNGTEGHWRMKEKQLELATGVQKLTFAFPQNGLNLHRIVFKKV